VDIKSCFVSCAFASCPLSTHRFLRAELLDRWPLMSSSLFIGSAHQPKGPLHVLPSRSKPQGSPGLLRFSIASLRRTISARKPGQTGTHEKALIIVSAGRVLFLAPGARESRLHCGVGAGKMPALPGQAARIVDTLRLLAQMNGNPSWPERGSRAVFGPCLENQGFCKAGCRIGGLCRDTESAKPRNNHRLDSIEKGASC